MPFINLIQEQRLQARKDERFARVGLFTLVGVSSLCFLGWGALTFQLERTVAEEAELKSKILKQAPLLLEIKTNKLALGELEPKLKTLEDARKYSDRWARLLSHLTVQTPGSTWLTSLRSNNQDPFKNTGVSIQGMSQNHNLISEFLLRTQNAKDFESVQLKQTKEKDWGGANAIEFELTAEIKGTAAPKPKEPAPEGAKA